MDLISSRALPENLRALISSLDRTVARYGFAAVDQGEWERDVEWKVDEIDLRIPKIARRRMLPAFRVAIPRTSESMLGDTYEYIAEVKLAKALDPTAEPDSYVKLPRFKFQLSRFIDTLVADIERALPWFDQFATPERCKANLAKFLKPDCPAYLDAENYLNSLIRKQ